MHFRFPFPNVAHQPHFVPAQELVNLANHTPLRMPSQDNIDVRVIVDNNDLIEYADPQDSVDRDQVQKRYVEAKVDARFRVQIKLLEGFNFKEADSVYCTVKIDEASILREFVIRKDKSQHRKCIIYEEMVDEVRRITHFNPETFAWESCPLLFGVIESGKSQM